MEAEAFMIPIFPAASLQNDGGEAREALLFSAIDDGMSDMKAGRYQVASSVEELFDQLDGQPPSDDGASA